MPVELNITEVLPRPITNIAGDANVMNNTLY